MKSLFLLFLAIATVASQPVSPSQQGRVMTTSSSVLGLDGTLDLKKIPNGTTIPAGLRMHLKRNLEPYFLPSSEDSEHAVDTDDIYWDGQFGRGDIDGDVYVMEKHDNSVYAGGAFRNAGTTRVNCVARWDGVRWWPLGSGVDAPYSTMDVRAMVFKGDTLYVCGTFASAGGEQTGSIAMWDGHSWHSLGGKVQGSVGTLTLMGNDLYAGGEFMPPGLSLLHVGRWDGSVWHSMPSEPNNVVTSLAATDTEVYAAGWFDSVGTVAVPRFARWNGQVWTTVPGPFSNPYTMLVHDGSLYLGGLFDIEYGGQRFRSIARWDGAKWNAMGEGLTDPDVAYVWTMCFVGQDLCVTGHFLESGSVIVNNLAKWNGTDWSAIGNGMPGYSDAVLSSDSTGIVVFGHFGQQVDGNGPQYSFARWDGSSWVYLQTSPHNGLNGSLECFAVFDSSLYVGGRFSFIGGVAAHAIARWDGNSWSTLGPGLTSSQWVTVYSMKVYHNELYVGGYFDTAGEYVVHNIARWNGNSWFPLNGDGVGGGGGVNPVVRALEVYKDTLYIGGKFQTAGGYDAINLAQWDGNDWVISSSPHLFEAGTVEVLASTDSFLYAGGNFLRIGSMSAGCIGRWDGTSWSNLHGGVGGSDPAFGDLHVSAIGISNTGLIVGGLFRTAGNIDAINIALLEGENWSAIGAGTDGEVRSVFVRGDEIFIGGVFTTVDGNISHAVARVAGGAWSTLGTGIFGLAYFDGTVATICEYHGELFFGGAFHAAGDKASSGIARWTKPKYLFTVNTSLQPKWNIVSLPVTAENDSVSSFFPTANGGLGYGFSGAGYVSSSTLAQGTGYWIKCPAGSVVTLRGNPISVDTVNVTAGWNLIGSIAYSIPTSSVESIATSIISPFYTFSTGYISTNVLEPGRGYWVKVNGNGKIILKN